MTNTNTIANKSPLEVKEMFEKQLLLSRENSGLSDLLGSIESTNSSTKSGNLHNKDNGDEKEEEEEETKGQGNINPSTETLNQDHDTTNDNNDGI